MFSVIFFAFWAKRPNLFIVYTITLMVEDATDIFSNIRVETESIASIAEEHSSATEEMLATMQEQSANIETIFNSVQEIKISSENLRSIIKS